MWGSWGIGMMLMMFLCGAVLLVALVVFIRWLVTADNRGPRAESALDILQRRCAPGEISKEAFQDMRQVLREWD